MSLVHQQNILKVKYDDKYMRVTLEHSVSIQIT